MTNVQFIFSANGVLACVAAWACGFLIMGRIHGTAMRAFTFLIYFGEGEKVKDGSKQLEVAHMNKIQYLKSSRHTLLFKASKCGFPQ